MKTIKLFLMIALVSVSSMGSMNAQCNDGKNLSARVVDVLKDYSSVISSIPYAEQVKQIAKHWNTIAGNSSAKAGPRQMYLDNSKVGGVVVGPTKRTFISPMSEHNKLEISLEKVSGKAKTDIFICVHDLQGGSKQVKEYRFENGKTKKTKKFTINNVKGKLISVVVKGKSAGNTFGYKLRAKKAN